VEFCAPVDVSRAEEVFQSLSTEKSGAWKYYGAEQDMLPQPARVLKACDMRAHVGRLRQTGTHRLSLVVLGHNLVRGAAGAALANLDMIQSSRSEIHCIGDF